MPKKLRYQLTVTLGTSEDWQRLAPRARGSNVPAWQLSPWLLWPGFPAPLPLEKDQKHCLSQANVQAKKRQWRPEGAVVLRGQVLWLTHFLGPQHNYLSYCGFSLCPCFLCELISDSLYQPKKKDVGRSPIHIDLKHLFASVFSAKSPEAPSSLPKGTGQEGKRTCPATLLRSLS